MSRCSSIFLSLQQFCLSTVLTTLAVPSSGVPVAAVAGGAVGGVLIVLLIALILLIVIISSIVCFRRKRSKYALKGLYEYSSPDTVNFVGEWYIYQYLHGKLECVLKILTHIFSFHSVCV